MLFHRYIHNIFSIGINRGCLICFALSPVTRYTLSMRIVLVTALNNVVLLSLKWLKWLKYSMEDLVSIELSE